jgi:hypothetical protein
MILYKQLTGKNMKNILIAIAILSLSYLLHAFVYNKLNAFEWTQNQRTGLVVINVFVFAIIYVIKQTKEI